MLLRHGLAGLSYVSAATGLTVTYQAASTTTAAGTSHTFSSMAIGTADANRWVIAAIGTRNGTQPTTVTIGGVSATKLYGFTGGSSSGATFWAANVTSGTTGDVAVSGWTASAADSACYTYTCISSSGLTVVDTAGASNTTNDLSLDTTTGSAVLAVMGSGNSDQPTLAGLTEDNKQDLSTGEWVLAGSASNVTAETPRAVSITTTSGVQTAKAAVSFRKT